MQSELRVSVREVVYARVLPPALREVDEPRRTLAASVLFKVPSVRSFSLKTACVDAGKATAKTTVSSINYSKTSFTKNREAGAVLQGDAALLAGMQAVYERDFANGLPATAPTDIPPGALRSCRRRRRGCRRCR